MGKKRIKPLNGNVLLYCGYGALLLLIAFIILVSFIFDQPIKRFTSDPADISDTHPFNGFMSNIGVLLWFCAATCSFFAYYVCRFYDVASKRLQFLLYSSILSIILGVDDLFMLHEYILPETLHIPQLVVYGIYVLFVSAYLVIFYQQILLSQYKLFVLALFFLCSSVACDVLLSSRGMQYILEDGFKILGIFTWFSYFFSTSASSLMTSFGLKT